MISGLSPPVALYCTKARACKHRSHNARLHLGFSVCVHVEASLGGLRYCGGPCGSLNEAMGRLSHSVSLPECRTHIYIYIYVTYRTLLGDSWVTGNQKFKYVGYCSQIGQGSAYLTVLAGSEDFCLGV